MVVKGQCSWYNAVKYSKVGTIMGGAVGRGKGGPVGPVCTLKCGWLVGTVRGR